MIKNLIYYIATLAISTGFVLLATHLYINGMGY